MRHHLATSREESVKFLNSLNAKANFYKPVVPNKPELKDKKDQLFQFTAVAERTMDQGQ